MEFHENTQNRNFSTCNNGNENLEILIAAASKVKKLNGTYLETILRQITESEYRQIAKFSNEEYFAQFVKRLCSMTNFDEVSGIIVCSEFLANTIKYGAVIKDAAYNPCKQWTLQALSFVNPTTAPILIILQHLIVTGQFKSINQSFNKLLEENSILLRNINLQNEEWGEVQFLVLSCLSAFISKSIENKHSIDLKNLNIIEKCVLQTLSKLPCKGLDEMYYNKMVKICLRLLRSILLQKTNHQDVNNIGELFGIIQVYLFYGIEGYPTVQPKLLLPCNMNLPERDSTPRKKYLRNNKNKKHCNKKSNDSKLNVSLESKAVKYSSDSETSDAENKYKCLPQLNSKIRLEAAHLLNEVIQNAKNRDIFGYWMQIVASGSQSDSRTLMKYILRETVSKNQQVVLSTLYELWLESKIFLTHAQDLENTSFDTIFTLLGSAIREMHYAINKLLTTERNIIVLAQVLKCAVALAEVTTYSKLKPGLATELAENCRNLLTHKDPTIKVCSLRFFETLALSEPTTPEILELLTKSVNDNGDIEFNTASETEAEEMILDDLNESINDINFSIDETYHETGVSDLVQICLKYSRKSKRPLKSNETVQVQALKLLRALAFNATDLILPHLEVIVKNLIDLIKEHKLCMQVSCQSFRVLEILAGCMKNLSLDQALKYWEMTISHFISFLDHTDANIREIAADCLANMSNEIFVEQNTNRTTIIVSLLNRAEKDEESAVRAASLRALGLFVTLPKLQEDTGFLEDVSNATCEAYEDENLGVKIKAIWAMANLTDACIKREFNNNECETNATEKQYVDEINAKVFEKLYRVSVKAADGHEKVKCNAVRAIGNVIYVCAGKSILNDLSSGIKVIVSCVKSSNDMKVKWNACHALGTILSRDPDSNLPSGWKDIVFPTLINELHWSPNFKVRTNAAWALSVCESFGDYLVSLWKEIMLAFENSQHVPNYVEYSHRNALVQQLCLTFCHLAVYTNFTELDSLWPKVKDYFDEISPYLKQFQEHILPEKAGDLLKAKTQYALFRQKATTQNEKEFTEKMMKIFENDNYHDIR